MFEGETETELNPAMQQRARAAGLVMRRPQWSPNTSLVHEATVYAKGKGLDGKFHHVAAGAYWETGADLSDMETLRILAEQSGLGWAELAPLLASRHYQDTVLQQLEAAKSLGVLGTPTYLIAGELLKGDVSLEDLQAAVKEAGKV
jgi:predicted DsbA family dithiol-disulfide isomerase